MRKQSVVFCILLGCGDNIALDADEGIDDITPPYEPSVPSKPPPMEQAVVEDPGKSMEGSPMQVTVLSEDELDLEDATILQISVPEKHRPYVLAGAQKLLATTVLADDLNTAIHLAQGLLLNFALADIVVVAEALEESKQEGVVERSTFTFLSKDIIKGQAPEKWAIDFLTEAASCGVHAPGLHEEALFFLDLTEGGPSLVDNGAIRAIRNGKIAGFPGIGPETADLKAAHLAGEMVQP